MMEFARGAEDDATAGNAQTTIQQAPRSQRSTPEWRAVDSKTNVAVAPGPTYSSFAQMSFRESGTNDASSPEKKRQPATPRMSAAKCLHCGRVLRPQTRAASAQQSATVANRIAAAGVKTQSMEAFHLRSSRARNL